MPDPNLGTHPANPLPGWLPGSLAQPATAQAAAPATTPRDLTIDVVDDDLSVLRALGRLIRSHGSTPRTFASGLEFLNSLDKQVPDCLILDVQMPGMSGLDVQNRLRARGLNIPIIFITAHEDPQAQRLALRNGAVAFFPKPLRNQLLWSAICSSTARAGKAGGARSDK